MRSILFTAATALLALPAYATSCDYDLTVMLAGTTPMKTHECWDLTKWPADKASSFCSMLGGATADEGGSVKATQVPACTAGAVARCTGAKYQAVGAASMPPEYFKQMPPEIAAQIKAGMEEAGAPMKQYNGLETTVYYYPDPSGTTTIEAQKLDCVNGKKGTFVQQ